jgi:hypothetical protein
LIRFEEDRSLSKEYSFLYVYAQSFCDRDDELGSWVERHSEVMNSDVSSQWLFIV